MEVLFRITITSLPYPQDHAQAVQASILLAWTRIGRP